MVDAIVGADPWQIGVAERRGGIWQAMWRRMTTARQTSGDDAAVEVAVQINVARTWPYSGCRGVISSRL